MKRSFFAAPYALWSLMFTVVPLIMVVYYAFTSKDGSASVEGFIRFWDPVYRGVLWHSLVMAFLSTLICLVIGYPAAYFLASKDFARGSTLLVLFIVPMWMNFLLRTYAWMTLLEDTGLINRLLMALGFPRARLMYTEGAVLMGMVGNFLPFMVLPIHSVLKKIDPRVIEAAEDLGADGVRVMLRVIVPLSIPGVISGITMVFMPAVTTFVISRLLGGGQFMLFGDLIEQQFLVAGNWQFGSTLSLIMMALIILSMAVMKLADPEGEGGGVW